MFHFNWHYSVPRPLYNNPTVKLPLPTEDIMDLLNLCLISTYFQYNGKHYKQLHRTAMGSPVSVVVAEIVMQHVEERALATCRQTIPLWLCYVDDTFTAVHKDEIDNFHDHLNACINVKPEGGGTRAYVGHLTSIFFPILGNLTKDLGPRVGTFAFFARRNKTKSHRPMCSSVRRR